MAVCRWLYANAKMEGDRKDYFVRICDPVLEVCKGKLIELSNRLLSADKRRGKAQKQICWFAGHISREIYLVAVGGGQEELLGISKGRYREQYCVLGYGLTGDDICLLRKDDGIFEPLKEIMREIQRTGTEDKTVLSESTRQDFSAYRMDGAGLSDSSMKNESGHIYNIRLSTEQTDQALWKESLQRPAMLGIISTEDGKRLLQSFPDGIVTVMEDVKIRYDAAGGLRDKSRLGNNRQPQQPLKSREQYPGSQRNCQTQNQKFTGAENKIPVQNKESREKPWQEQKLTGEKSRIPAQDKEAREKPWQEQKLTGEKSRIPVQDKEAREKPWQEQKLTGEKGRIPVQDKEAREKHRQEQKLTGEKSRIPVQDKESREKQTDQKRQELKKQKRLEQARLVKYWAGWCKEHLSSAQVEAVRKAVEQMKREKKWSGKESVFFRLCEYSAYMLLWHDKKKRRKEQEIYFLTESWADTINIKKTVQLAELIERLNETSGRAD